MNKKKIIYILIAIILFMLVIPLIATGAYNPFQNEILWKWRRVDIEKNRIIETNNYEKSIYSFWNYASKQGYLRFYYKHDSDSGGREGYERYYSPEGPYYYIQNRKADPAQSDIYDENMLTTIPPTDKPDPNTETWSKSWKRYELNKITGGNGPQIPQNDVEAFILAHTNNLDVENNEDRKIYHMVAQNAWLYYNGQKSYSELSKDEKDFLEEAYDYRDWVEGIKKKLYEAYRCTRKYN